jgi:hypothetical protein
LDLLERFGKKALTSYLLIDVDMQWFDQTQRGFDEIGQRVTVTAFLLKCISIAQKNHPASRTFTLLGARRVTYEDITAGFTVERIVDGEPIVFFGEIEHSAEVSLVDLASALKNYSDADLMSVPKLRQQLTFARMPWLVRQVIFTAAELFPRLRLMCMASTFGLSNLGSIGITACFGPSVCTSVFGVGGVADRVVAIDGEVAIRRMMTLSLSFDLRAMSPGQAAAFLQEVRHLAEGGLAAYICSDLEQLRATLPPALVSKFLLPHFSQTEATENTEGALGTVANNVRGHRNPSSVAAQTAIAKISLKRPFPRVGEE